MKITRTLLVLGAGAALVACGDAPIESSVSIVQGTSPERESTDAQDDITTQLAWEIAWSDLDADDKATMCDGYRMLDADQFARLVAAYAADLDADALYALLDKEC